MKVFAKVLVIVCAAGIGLSLGFALRKKGAADRADLSNEATSLSDPAENGAPGSKSKARVPAPDDSPLTTQLERDLSMSKGVTRWLYWLEAIEKAAPADFPRLARLAHGNPAAFRLVAQRWVELYPQQLLDALVAASEGGPELPIIELSNQLFTDWTKRDPQAVLAALNASGNSGMRNQWQHTIATTIFEKDVELGLKLMSQWHIESFGPRMNSVAKWAAADPRHAAEFALANPAGFATELTLEAVGKEWGKIDPTRALEFATAKPGATYDRLATSVLKEWAAQNYNDAAKWLAGADVRVRNRLSPAFVESWAKQDAAGAMAWCEANLAGSSLTQAVSGVMKGVADKNVDAAAKLVTELSPSEARTEAAAAVARKWLPAFLSDKPFPPEALAWLGSLDSDSMRRAVAEIQWSWAGVDPKGMAAFLGKCTGEQIPPTACNIVAREFVRTDPIGSLEWANRLPPQYGLSAGADAYAEWRAAQPDAATKWLDDLPATDARRQPYFQNAIRSLAYDNQAAQRLAALSTADRAAARGVIENMPLPDDRRSRLLEALKTN